MKKNNPMLLSLLVFSSALFSRPLPLLEPTDVPKKSYFYSGFPLKEVFASNPPYQKYDGKRRFKLKRKEYVHEPTAEALHEAIFTLPEMCLTWHKEDYSDNHWYIDEQSCGDLEYKDRQDFIGLTPNLAWGNVMFIFPDKTNVFKQKTPLCLTNLKNNTLSLQPCIFNKNTREANLSQLWPMRFGDKYSSPVFSCDNCSRYSINWKLVSSHHYEFDYLHILIPMIGPAGNIEYYGASPVTTVKEIKRHHYIYD